MKYRQLTKEQLENLHKEFALFLASQEIDAKEWTRIKEKKPTLVEKEINLFSDVVWEDVLTKTNYLEHFSKKSINLFKCDKKRIQRLVIQVNKKINLLEKEDFDWLLSHPKESVIEYLKGSKNYKKERNTEIFDLIEKGSNISNRELFEFFTQLVS